MTIATLTDHSRAFGTDPAGDAARTRRGRRTLLLLAFVCALPVIASYLAFYVWPPQARVNYGALIEPVPLPDGALDGLAGQLPLARDAFSGHWTLLYVGEGGCHQVCADVLYTMRQSRLAQAKEMARVARVWLVSDDAAVPTVPAQHDGLRVARADAAWLAAIPDAVQGVHLYLVDPLGNVMMRFPAQADPKGVIKDLQRLLKYSALGRS